MKKLHLMITAALFAVGLPTAALALGPGPVAPAAESFRVGKLSFTSLADTEYVVPNDGKLFGVDASSEAVAQVLKDANAPTDTVYMAVDALLVRDGKRIVLIDTGLGPKAGGSLLASLKLAAVTPDMVTDVLITHTHPDHIGGLVTAGDQSAFPKAKIRITSVDWKWLQSVPDFAPIVKAISAQVVPFEPGEKVAPDITSVPIKGHTAGHVGYQIVSGKARLLDIGDAAHSSIVSLAKPDWTMGYDGDAKVAKASRRKILTELSDNRETIFAPHFPFPGIGTISAEGDHFAWKPLTASGQKEGQ